MFLIEKGEQAYLVSVVHMEAPVRRSRTTSISRT